MALANLGVDLYMGEGRLLEGLEKLRRAAELNPDWHLVHAHLGRIYERLALEDDSVAHYLLAAERVLRETTRGDVQLGNIMRLGNTMAKGSEYPEVREAGLELLRGAAEDDGYSRVPSVVSDYASALLANERYDEALAAFDRSVEMDPSGAMAVANRGICRGKLGQPREALADFLRALELGGGGHFVYTTEHILELFREHREADFGEALDRLRAKLLEGVERGNGDARGADDARSTPDARDADVAAALWSLWLTVALWIDRKDLVEVIAGVDALASKAPEGRGAGARARAGEIRWALEGWRDGGAIRINCGGEEYRDKCGVLWHSDRFFVGGMEHDVTQDTPGWSADRGRLSGADDPTIYGTVRLFPEKSPGPGGYRVPVVPGNYRVTLHFVEMFSNPSQGRVFDVKIEGETVLGKHRPQGVGVAAADRRTFEVRDAEALLEIILQPVRGSPQVCAIEIERM
jgi:tetratricopeptide (TPR) repeat protein